MDVDKQLRFNSHKSKNVEFFLTNVDVMTHDRFFSVALALGAHVLAITGETDHCGEHHNER